MANVEWRIAKEEGAYAPLFAIHSAAPPGLGGVGGTWTTGLRPWLSTFAPPGLAYLDRPLTTGSRPWLHASAPIGAYVPSRIAYRRLASTEIIGDALKTDLLTEP